MRGVYGNARRALPSLAEISSAPTQPEGDDGFWTSTVVGAALVDSPPFSQTFREQMVVGTVLTLSVVAVVTAAKVLSVKATSRRRY